MKLSLALGPMRTGTTSMYDSLPKDVNYVGSNIRHSDIRRMEHKENTALTGLWTNTHSGHPTECVYDDAEFCEQWNTIELSNSQHNWWINPIFNIPGLYLNPMLKYSVNKHITLKNHTELWRKPTEHFVSVLNSIHKRVDLTVIFGVRHPSLWLQSVYNFCRKYQQNSRVLDSTGVHLNRAMQSRLLIQMFGNNDKLKHLLSHYEHCTMPTDADDIRAYWCLIALNKTMTALQYAVELCAEHNINTELYQTEWLTDISPLRHTPHSFTHIDSNQHHELSNSDVNWYDSCFNNSYHSEELHSYKNLVQKCRRRENS